MNYKLAVIIIMCLLLPVPSLAMDNGYARIVYNVRGLQDYDLHWNDRFPPGSILKIYVESNGINHKRAVAVDYVFIIRDANDYIVDTVSFGSRYEDFRENDFVIYSKEVPKIWEDGAYTVEIHIFDLLNDPLMNKYYSNLTELYLNGSGRPSLPILNRNAVSSDQHKIIEKLFFVDRYANKYPVDRFRIENLTLDRNSVAPKEQVKVSFNISNTFSDIGSTSFMSFLDGKLMDNTTIEIEGFKSIQVNLIASSGISGDHLLEIKPAGPDTMGYLSAVFNVAPEKVAEKPTSFNIKDLQIDKLSVGQGDGVTISVIIENVGKEGSQPVELYINNKLEEQKEVRINLSETQDVKFNVTKPELGAYRVTIGNTNFSKIFFVESKENTTNVNNVTVIAVREKKPEFKYVLGLSVLIILIISLRFYLKWKIK